MNKINIFILTNTLKTGGAEKQSIYLYNALKGLYNVWLVVYYGNQLDRRMIDLLADKTDNNILYLNGFHIKKLLFLYRLFRKYPDSVCISYLATTNAINAIIGRLAGVSIRIGGIRSSEFHWIKKIIQRYFHNYLLNHTVFNNHQGLKKLSGSDFNPLKASVIHNAIDFPEVIKIENNRLTIISVGRFVESKDYNTSLKVLKRIINSIPSIKYLIIGQGKLESEIGGTIKELGLADNTEIIINPENINQYYIRSDIYLSTSLFEGLSNSIMEAMSFALPVVATDVGDNRFLIKDGETGYLTKIKDVETIASKLELLINDAELRKTMGEKGRQHLTENFSIEKFTQHYVGLIEKLSNKK